MPTVKDASDLELIIYGIRLSLGFVSVLAIGSHKWAVIEGIMRRPMSHRDRLNALVELKMKWESEDPSEERSRVA